MKGGSVAGGQLSGCAAENGALYEMEHADLPDLSPVCGTGGHPCVFD